MGLQAIGLGRIWKDALGLIYPPQCPGCGAPVGAEANLCPDCWREASFLTGGSGCRSCAVPLAGFADGNDPGPTLCDDCHAARPPWAGAVAAFAYEGTARRLVLALKHGDRPDLAPALGGWLAAAAAAAVQPGMIVVPIPLHSARLLRRKYNQAALVAGHAAARLGLPHGPALLRRLRNTPMQDHRTREERFANQAGAFAVPDRARAALAGRPVLLVDDVMASGATMAAAAEALAGAGAGPVTAAVIARATRM